MSERPALPTERRRGSEASTGAATSPSGRPARTPRQQEQNKQAQQRYRERRKLKVTEMEGQVGAMQQQLAELQSVVKQNVALQVRLSPLAPWFVQRRPSWQLRLAVILPCQSCTPRHSAACNLTCLSGPRLQHHPSKTTYSKQKYKAYSKKHRCFELNTCSPRGCTVAVGGINAIHLGPHLVLKPPEQLRLLRQDKTLKLEQQLAEQKRESQRLASQVGKAPADNGWPPARSAEALEELKADLQAQVIHLQQCVEQHRLRTADVSGTTPTRFPAACKQQGSRACMLCRVCMSLCACSV